MALFDGAITTPDQLAATAQLPEVTASAGPWQTAQLPVVYGAQKAPLQIIARSDPGGPVDRLLITAGRWATQPGEITLTHSYAQAIGAKVGDHLTVLSGADRRGLVIVGVGYLLFTYLVPIPKQPVWLTQARLTPLMQSSAEVVLSLVPSRDQADFTGTPPAVPAEKPKQDALGDLIRRENTQANKGSPEPAAAKKSAKTYGEKDRRALDTLLETTGKSGQ